MRRARRKRLISRFRADRGGVALYVDFRLHIPRKEMRFPPHHGPYSHEVSHGYIGFAAISPTGRYNEGLTEVSRTAYWWFLGLDGVWRTFQRSRLASLKVHYEEGGTPADVKGYGGAAAVYFVLLHRFCRRKDGSPDWQRFGRLLAIARKTAPAGSTPSERFALLLRVAGEAFGPEAADVLRGLRLPKS